MRNARFALVGCDIIIYYYAIYDSKHFTSEVIRLGESIDVKNVFKFFIIFYKNAFLRFLFSSGEFFYPTKSAKILLNLLNFSIKRLLKEPDPATAMVRYSQGPPLPGFTTPRVRHFQGPPLEGSATPRVRHSQGEPLYGIRTFHQSNFCFSKSLFF